MGQKTKYTCDVCHKAIKEGHQQYYMATITTEYLVSSNDGSAAGTDDAEDVYYVHNDFSNHCMGKVWDLLEKDRE